MQIHAVRLGAGHVLHEVGAVLGGAERALQHAAVQRHVVDALDGAQRVRRRYVRHVRGRRRTLHTKILFFKEKQTILSYLILLSYPSV